ncbi:hypothetical protein CY35_13G024900 [Sphagnum magellanicum]|nr:hypothetical protein CY35_13G024900 [Sphagnum magellanicum]
MAQGQYAYMRLQDAVLHMNERVNFYGVVAEYEQPKSTRGKDFICTMTVVDMSYHSSGLRVLYFARALEMLPRVRALGDIIRFHRIMMSNYEDAPQAQGHPSKGSAFVLLPGMEGQGYEPYQMSHSHFTLEQVDRTMVDLMRSWVCTHPLDMGSNKYMVSIKDMKVGSYFDLCCKILFVHDQDIDDRAVTIYVWDGTDAPPVGGLLEEPDIEDIEQWRWSHTEFTVSREVMQGFPTVGTVLPLLPDMPGDVLPPQLPVAGDWVKLRNLACRIHDGQYEGIILRESKISLLPVSTQLVQNCERAYQERLATVEGRLPQWCPKPPQCITVTDYDHVSFSTLREVLAHPQVEFFNGHPAADLREQGATVEALQRKVHRLLGQQDTGPHNPPWIKCCLKSYYTDKSHPWDSRQFRIFGTRFPG